MNASYVAPPVKEARHNSRTGSLASAIAARSHRASIRFFELDRVSLPRGNSRLVAAADDASDRLLHSETTETRVPVASSLPGAAVTRVCLSATPVDALVPRLAPRAHSRGVAPRAALSSAGLRPETRDRASRGSGRSMQVRPGKIAFHGATLTLVTRSCVRAALILPRVRSSSPPLTSLSPPPRLLLVESCLRSMRELEGRQDRFHGGLVKGVRFSDPRCLPSSGASQLPPVPKHERTAELSSRRGVHVMRIAAPRTNRPPFAPCGLRRLRASGSRRFRVGRSARG